MKRKIFTLGLIGCMMLSLAGCGSSSKYAMTQDTAAAESMNYAADMDYYASEEMGGGYVYEDVEVEWEESTADGNIGNSTGTTSDRGDSSASSALSQRKLIKTVDLNVETKEFDLVMATLENQVRELDGYIENMETYNGSTYSGYRSSRNASLTVRIPKDRLDGFLSTISEISNVVRRSENVVDVTLEYVDIESRKTSLETEQERLLELVAKAENLEDVITIEQRLSDVRYQLESMESQLRTFDNKVDYSTVYLYINEVKELTPVEEETIWERIAGGFMDSVRDIADGFMELCIWFVVHIPYLAIWAVVVVAVVIVIRKSIKKRRACKAKAKLVQPEEKNE